MPALRKRWRWVGCFSDEVMLCAAVARIGPGRVSWWAAWDRSGRTLAERATRRRPAVELPDGRLRLRDGPVAADLRLDLGGAAPWRASSLHGGRPIHTVKRCGVPVTGTVRLLDREIALDGFGVVDDSWGHHARRTAWRWSAGVGMAAGGERVAWNLVEGLHDGASGSERAVWVDGHPREVAPQAFAPDLSSVGGLAFSPEAARSHRERLLVVASAYEAPFGTFSGELDGLAIEGLGVMERHTALW